LVCRKSGGWRPDAEDRRSDVEELTSFLAMHR
jgi:hypothetical protein